MLKLFKKIKLNNQLKKNTVFLWDSANNDFIKINDFKSVPLDLLTGIDSQKKTLDNNTLNFAKGYVSNSALLWGSRGNGKSSLIKSIFFKYSKIFEDLRLIQIKKQDVTNINNIYTILRNYNFYRFILFIDDLSFEKIDNEYKILKSSLEGSIINQPNNIVIYVTSNRRHLMSKDMIDNERSSAIHTDENIEEKVSLSDRFGLWLGFHTLNQNDYIIMIKKYCDHFKINCDEADLKKSLEWSLIRGNRTGRTAWQFIIKIASEKNIKLDF
tara:strand:+ start:428 stop:1237 length:810 start_codon:yes stop_codon:yes gene_type:complete